MYVSYMLRYMRKYRVAVWKFRSVYIRIHIDKIYIGIITHPFLHTCTRVMALDLHQNFVFAQYLENKLTEFH